MEVTICKYCHKLVYVGFIEHSRFLFDDPKLEHPHTRIKCQQSQKDSGLENSVREIKEQLTELRAEVYKIKEKIGLD